MRYLLPEEYETYGLKAATPESVVAAASTLLDAHCRRASLGQTEYTERLRIGRGSARLTYLPVCEGGVKRVRGRYAQACRCFSEMGREVASTFGLPGGWVDLDAGQFEVDLATGEISVAVNPLGLVFDELEITYTAGFEVTPEPVKHACAMVVRNAMATPAANVRGTNLDAMHVEYFAASLLDANVKKLMAPYVAQKVA